MARPRLTEQQRLTKALTELHQVLGPECGVVRGNQIRNAARILLLEKGYLREILKGWYFVSDPLAAPGDTLLQSQAVAIAYFYLLCAGFCRRDRLVIQLSHASSIFGVGIDDTHSITGPDTHSNTHILCLKLANLGGCLWTCMESYCIECNDYYLLLGMKKARRIAGLDH